MIHHWLRQKHNLEEDDHDLFPIGAGQSRCRKLSHQKQFAMSGESGGPQLPAVLLFWSRQSCISSFVSILFSPLQFTFANDKPLQPPPPPVQLTNLHLHIQRHHH